MNVNIYEFEFDDGLYLNFEKFNKFDLIANIIEDNNIGKPMEDIIGIYSMFKTYKHNDFEFQLIHHEDLGNCLRLPIDRDRSQDEEKYKLLRKIGKEIITLLNVKVK